MYDGFGDLQDLYQQVILDHGRNPRNFRELAQASGRADGYNPLCGDQVTVYCKLEGDCVKDVSFTGKGCAICTASASMMTQMIKDKPLDQVRTLFNHFHDMVTAPEEQTPSDDMGKLGVFSGVRKYPMRVKCATLPWHTLNSSLEPGTTDPVSTE